MVTTLATLWESGPAELAGACFLAYLLTCLRPPGAAHCVLHHLCPKHTERSRSRSCGVVRPSQLPSAPELEDSCTETAAETAVVHTVASSSCPEDLSVPFSLPFPFIDPCIHPTVGRSHAYTVPSPYLVSFHPYPIINVLFMGSRMAQFLNLSRLIPLTLPHFPPRASAAYSRIYIDTDCRTTLEHPSYAYSSLLPLCTLYLIFVLCTFLVFFPLLAKRTNLTRYNKHNQQLHTQSQWVNHLRRSKRPALTP